jgi:energy-coupling factor transport system substrate-specific component
MKQPAVKPKSYKTASVLTRKITLLACLSALSIVGRVSMAAIPNVQPSTMIIICGSLVFGIQFGLGLAVLTVFGSNMMLGMGPFVFMQLLGWGTVAILSGLLGKKALYKKIPHVGMSIYASFSGYLYGFLVSLNVLFIGGPISFWAYYIAGLPFDTYHAAGNFFFYLLLSPIIIQLLEKEKKKMELIRGQAIGH